MCRGSGARGGGWGSFLFLFVFLSPTSPPQTSLSALSSRTLTSPPCVNLALPCRTYFVCLLVHARVAEGAWSGAGGRGTIAKEAAHRGGVKGRRKKRGGTKTRPTKKIRTQRKKVFFFFSFSKTRRRPPLASNRVAPRRAISHAMREGDRNEENEIDATKRTKKRYKNKLYSLLMTTFTSLGVRITKPAPAHHTPRHFILFILFLFLFPPFARES